MLLVLMIPGVARRVEPVGAPRANDLAVAKSITQAMEDKLGRGRREMTRDVCTAQDPAKAGSNTRSETGRRMNELATRSVVFILADIDLAKAPKHDKADGGQTKTALGDVAAPTPAGDAEGDNRHLYSIGSGFAIGPKTVVTNRHVIENAKRIYVTNRLLAKVRPATILATTSGSEIGSSDFAVLSIEADQPLPAVPLSVRAEPLQNVVAAGFPGNVTTTDPLFQRLMGGDATAVPEVVLTPGYVSTIQDVNGQVPRLIHTAAIAAGNSGGPLIDYCGAVVGINTFLVRPEGSSYTVFQALAARALTDFLSDKGIPFAQADAPCAANANVVPTVLVPPVASAATP